MTKTHTFPSQIHPKPSTSLSFKWKLKKTAHITILREEKKKKGAPLPLLIRRFSKLDISLPLLQQRIYAIASPCHRNLPQITSISNIPNQWNQKLEQHLARESSNNRKQTDLRKQPRTGSLAKRSREAGNPKVTSVWFRYLVQCSRFPASAKAYSLQEEEEEEERSEP